MTQDACLRKAAGVQDRHTLPVPEDKARKVTARQTPTCGAKSTKTMRHHCGLGSDGVCGRLQEDKLGTRCLCQSVRQRSTMSPWLLRFTHGADPCTDCCAKCTALQRGAATNATPVCKAITS